MKVLLVEMEENINRIAASSALIHEKCNVIAILRMAAQSDREEIHEKAYARGLRFVEKSVFHMMARKNIA